MLIHPPNVTQAEPGSGGGGRDCPCSLCGILCSASAWNQSLSTGDSGTETAPTLGSCSQVVIKGFLAVPSPICVLSPVSVPDSHLEYKVLSAATPPRYFEWIQYSFPLPFLRSSSAPKHVWLPNEVNGSPRCSSDQAPSSQQLCSITQTCWTLATFHMGSNRRNSWMYRTLLWNHSLQNFNVDILVGFSNSWKYSLLLEAFMTICNLFLQLSCKSI